MESVIAKTVMPSDQTETGPESPAHNSQLIWELRIAQKIMNGRSGQPQEHAFPPFNATSHGTAPLPAVVPFLDQS